MTNTDPNPLTQGESRAVWYSICSAHEFDPSCPRCRVGSWVDEADPQVIADKALWEADPDAWRAAHVDSRVELVTRDA